MAKLEAGGVPHGDISLVGNNEATGIPACSARRRRRSVRRRARRPRTGPAPGPPSARWSAARRACSPASPRGDPGRRPGWWRRLARGDADRRRRRRGGGRLAVRSPERGSARRTPMPTGKASAGAAPCDRQGGGKPCAMVMDVLEEHGSVDLDQNRRPWTREGWTPLASSGSAASPGPPLRPACPRGGRGCAAIPAPEAASDGIRRGRPDPIPARPPPRGADRVGSPTSAIGAPRSRTAGLDERRASLDHAGLRSRRRPRAPSADQIPRDRRGGVSKPISKCKKSG